MYGYILLLTIGCVGIVTKKYINLVFHYIKYKYIDRNQTIKLDKYLLVPYNYHHYKYYSFIPIKIKNKPNIIAIYNENNKDVYNLIKPYMGHNLNFSGVKITPNILGFRYLKFMIMNKIGEINEFVFKENETIIISELSN